MAKPIITAVTARRDEPDWLLADLRANLSGWVDRVLVIQVDRVGPWAHEGHLNELKRSLLRAHGATWSLFIDPDERIENGAGELILDAVAHAGRSTVFGFPLKELWTPDAYRVDGDCGNKLPRHRLFRLREGQRFPSKPIHCGVCPRGTRGDRSVLDANMYHLKNIEPANRLERAKAYLDADPDFQHQRRETALDDWSWLHSETGLELEKIPAGREFSPPYVAGSYTFTAPR